MGFDCQECGGSYVPLCETLGSSHDPHAVVDTAVHPEAAAWAAEPSPLALGGYFGQRNTSTLVLVDVREHPEAAQLDVNGFRNRAAEVMKYVNV